MSKKVMLFLAAFALMSAVADSQPFQKGWMCGMMDWMPQQGISQENLPERDSAQAKTYARFCAQCHALPTPLNIQRRIGTRWWREWMRE